MAGSILIVASSPEQRESLATPLRAEGYAVAVAHDGTEAIRALHSSPVDTVVILRSGTDLSANKLRVRLLQERRAARVILLTQFSSMKGGQRVYSYGVDSYQMTERELLGFLSTKLTSGEQGSDADNAVQSLVQTIDVLIGLQELGDRHFGGTSHRVALLANSIAEEMSFDREMTRELILAALLRDIGKAGLDPTVISEDGAFSAEQVTGMKEHVGSGVRLLEHIDYPWKVLPILRHHHERYDGMGYPDGLRGPEIPLGARILAAVDSYVALISGRSYKSSVSPDEAFDELQRHAGTQFDPEIVEVLIRVAEKRTAAVASNEKPKVLITGSSGSSTSACKLCGFRAWKRRS
jgi:putative two-component system response regulator